MKKGELAKQKRTKKLLVLVVAGAVLVLAGRRGWLAPLKTAATAVFDPIGRGLSAAGSGTGNWFHEIGQIKDLSSRNARLEAENATLRQQLSQDSELRLQNDTLRQQLGFNPTPTRKLIPAEVASYQPDNFRGYLTLGRGTNDGIKVGQAVVLGGALVGRVSEATPISAKVWLLSDPNFRLNGLDQQSRATGTVNGALGTGLVMDKIAQTDAVKPGDTIITSGLGDEVPKGIIIGRVETVATSDNAVFQTATLSSDVKFTRLELVFVVVSL